MNPQKEQQKICLRSVLIDKAIQLSKRYEESNDEVMKKHLQILLDFIILEYRISLSPVHQDNVREWIERIVE